MQGRAVFGSGEFGLGNPSQVRQQQDQQRSQHRKQRTGRDLGQQAIERPADEDRREDDGLERVIIGGPRVEQAKRHQSEQLHRQIAEEKAFESAAEPPPSKAPRASHRQRDQPDRPPRGNVENRSNVTPTRVVDRPERPTRINEDRLKHPTTRQKILDGKVGQNQGQGNSVRHDDRPQPRPSLEPCRQENARAEGRHGQILLLDAERQGERRIGRRKPKSLAPAVEPGSQDQQRAERLKANAGRVGSEHRRKVAEDRRGGDQCHGDATGPLRTTVEASDTHDRHQADDCAEHREEPAGVERRQ